MTPREKFEKRALEAANKIADNVRKNNTRMRGAWGRQGTPNQDFCRSSFLKGAMWSYDLFLNLRRERERSKQE